MADSIIGTSIKQLPEAAQSQLNDSTDLIVEDTVPTTRRTKLLTLANWIKAKLSIGTASSLKTTSKEIVGAINELNSALTTKREEKTVSTFLPPTILYRYGKIVMFRCAGMPQKDMQPNVDYQIGTIPEGFRPIVNTYEYKKYNANRECRVVINNDGTASIRFFDDVATTVGININMTYIAE